MVKQVITAIKEDCLQIILKCLDFIMFIYLLVHEKKPSFSNFVIHERGRLLWLSKPIFLIFILDRFRLIIYT